MNAHVSTPVTPPTATKVDIIDTAHTLQYDVRILDQILDRAWEDAKYAAENAGRHHANDPICRIVDLLAHQANVIRVRLNELVAAAEQQLVRS